MDALLLKLGKSRKAWSGFLRRTYGIPEEPRGAREVGESGFVNESGQLVSLETIAASRGIFASYSGLESTSPEWLRSREMIRVILTILISENRGGDATVKMRDELDDIPPMTELPRFPENWGSPEGLVQRWEDHEVFIRLRYDREQATIILVEESIPPDEPEDLDQAGEPDGRWEGLVWIPNPPQTGRS